MCCVIQFYQGNGGGGEKKKKNSQQSLFPWVYWFANLNLRQIGRGVPDL